MSSIENVSDTARWVAVYRAMETARPDAIFRDPYAGRLAGDRGVQIVDEMKQGRSMAWAMIVRTAVMDEMILDRINNHGVDTVLNLAAGLDTRAWRLPLKHDLHWVDVDLPAMTEYKATRMRGETPVCRYEAIAADLTDAAIRDALFSQMERSARKMLVITEGLLIYLPPEAQDRLLDNITALSAAGSRLATEHMSKTTLTGDWADKLTERARRMGSTIDLAGLFYSGERNTARDYLGRHGWTTSVLLTEDAYAANGFQLPANEWTALAIDSVYLTAVLGRQA